MTNADTTIATPIDDVLGWIARTVGGRVVDSIQLNVSRSRVIWSADVDRGGVVLPVIARVDAGGGPLSGTRFTLGREARLLAALQHAGIPIPAIHAVADDGRAMIMQRLPGAAPLAELDVDARARTIRAYVEALAGVHALDVFALNLPAARAPTRRDGTLADLADYLDAYDRLCRRHAIVDCVRDWLHANAPAPDGPARLLHGDAGPGNFLHRDGRITGLIDWEMSHIGDPADDLAWIWFRNAILKADLEADSYFNAYADVTGARPDRQALLYYILIVVFRCTVVCHVRQYHDPEKSDDRPRQLREMLEAALGDARDEGSRRLPDLPAIVG